MLKHSSDPTSRKVMEHSPPETFDDGRFQPLWIGLVELVLSSAMMFGMRR